MDKYSRFFGKVAEAYGSAEGYNNALRGIREQEFRDGLSEEQLQIAVGEFHKFFEGRNTHGGNRIFGFSPKDIEELAARCRSKEI